MKVRNKNIQLQEMMKSKFTGIYKRGENNE
jgi:hypothetical protein